MHMMKKKTLKWVKVVILPFLTLVVVVAAMNFKEPIVPKNDLVESSRYVNRLPASVSDLELAKKTQNIFIQNCFACHGEPGKKVRGGFDTILDFDKLRDNPDYVNLDNPDQSGLYVRIFNDEMPTGKEFRKLTNDEKKTVLDWISAGAPSLASKTVKDSAGTSKYSYITDAIAKDLEKFSSDEQKNIRYLSIAHMPSSGDSPEDTEVFRDALTKLVNSLSFEPTPVPLVAIDSNELIFRLKLKDYGWNKEKRRDQNDIWEELGHANPYNIFESDIVTEKIKKLTKSQFPFLRGDWFASVASAPPFYHDFLQLPDTDTELENILKVDLEGNIKNGIAIRSGFTDSGVSKNNRIIERHPSRFGAYWISYDFSNSIDTSDILARPLGPGEESADFIHDGGEIIFNLPNGLQGYLLVNSKHQRLDIAPISIVQDTSRRDATIINGISCMACHSQGMRVKSDQVREYVLGHEDSYSEDDFKQITKLYKTSDKLSQVFKKDSVRFIEAMKSSGVKNLKGDLEPVRYLTDRFEKNINTKVAAAELGVSESFLLSEAQKKSKVASIVSRMSGKGVTRSFFINSFAQLKNLLGPVLSDSSGNSINKLGMTFVLIAPGKFIMGSPKSELYRNNDEPQIPITISRGYEMQSTPVTQAQWVKVMGNNPSRFIGANRPVETVSWNDAQKFIKKLNATISDGYTYRLPTEAEWEYAVRERGAKKTAYFFGDDASKLSRFAWFGENSGDQTHDVADNGLNQRNKNALGLVDMIGNVAQWCEDLNAYGPGDTRVNRGGSWISLDRYLRSAFRGDGHPDARESTIGFRLVRTR